MSKPGTLAAMQHGAIANFHFARFTAAPPGELVRFYNFHTLHLAGRHLTAEQFEIVRRMVEMQPGNPLAADVLTAIK